MQGTLCSVNGPAFCCGAGWRGRGSCGNPGRETHSPHLPLTYNFSLFHSFIQKTDIKYLLYARCYSKCWEYDSEENRQEAQPQRPCHTNLCQGSPGGSSVRPGKRAGQRNTNSKPVPLLSASLARDKPGRRCQDPSCILPVSWSSGLLCDYIPLLVKLMLSNLPFQGRHPSSLLLCHLCPVYAVSTSLPQSRTRISVIKYT